MRLFATCLMVLALVLGPVTVARAQDPYPTAIDASNPYAQVLPEAKLAYDSARTAYDQAAAHAYDSWAAYSTYYRAYYALWNAYTRYAWYLSYYQYYETATRFKGQVVLEDNVDYLPRPPSPAIAGATVQLTSYVRPGMGLAIRLIGTYTTEADGRFHFDGLTSGAYYAYTVNKTGYAQASGTFQARAGSGELTIRLRKTSGLSGVVVAKPLYGAIPIDPPPGWNDPRPLAGVKCTLYRTDVVYIRDPGPTAVVTTDSEGKFEFPDASYSSARVVFELNNYTTQTQSVALSAGPQTLRVLMVYSGPPVPVANPGGISADDLIRR